MARTMKPVVIINFSTWKFVDMPSAAIKRNKPVKPTVERTRMILVLGASISCNNTPTSRF